MEFYCYINEEIEFDKIKEILKNKCGPILKDLYRNRNNIGQLPLIGKRVYPNKSIMIKKTRKNRRPKDTPAVEHWFIDNYFFEKYGHRFRSNAIFSTGRYSDAKSYGNVFILLPIGKYEVLWHRHIPDLYSFLFEDNPDMADCIYALTSDDHVEPNIDHDLVFYKWEDLYGEGGEGYWKFSKFQVHDVGADTAVDDILDEMGISNNDYDEIDMITDIYDSRRKYIVNYKHKQDTLFQEPTAVGKLIYKGETLATMYESKNGKFFVENGNKDKIPDKQGNWEFIDKEYAWSVAIRGIVKDIVVEGEVPVPIYILKDFYDEKWAYDIVKHFDTYAITDIAEYISNNMEWTPDVSFEDYLDRYIESHGTDLERCEDMIYNVLSEYEKGNITDAIKSNNEMMIACDKYILIDYKLNDFIIEWIKSGMK